MTTLSDLTLKQLTAIFGTVAQVATSPKTFNSRSKALGRLETLLAEKNLTIAEAMSAAGIADEAEPAALEPTTAAPEIEADHDGHEPEQTAPSGEDDIPGGELPPEPEAAPAAEVPETPDAATILTSSSVINDTRDWLVRYLIDRAGLDPETAVLAALRAVAALKLPALAARPESPRQPRTGSKQDQVIALLRRPEGATLAEIGEATLWAPHTCRGVLAGALKKRLGLTVTSTKEAGGQRTYRLAAS